MKIILPLLIFCAFYTRAQNVVYSEDFEGGAPNATWVNQDLLPSGVLGFGHADSAWIVQDEGWYLYANAAASPAIANKVIGSTSTYTVSGNSDDWLMLPQTVLPANSYFTWSTRGLRTSVSNFAINSYEVLLSTTGTSPADYTTTLHTVSWPAYEWYHHYLDLGAYAGQNVSIAIRNVSSNAYMLLVDNLELIELLNYDVAGVEVTNKIGVEQGTNESITGSLRNYGNSTIISMDLNYRINGGTVVSENLTGLSIAPLEYYDFSHGTPWTPLIVGSALIEVWASNINGNADLLNANDITSKTVEIYEDITLKRPLYEDLSSRECSPCKYWNEFIHPFLQTDWDANLPNGDVSAIYYMMNFPGDPDPSNNNDADLRWAYYGYSGLPQNYIDGWSSIHGTIFDQDWITPTTYDEYSYAETPAFIELNVSATATGNNIAVTVDVEPLKDITSTDLKLHIVVSEAHYTTTPGFNGETDFYYVMRKMLPDGTGTSIGPLTQYNSVQVAENYTFTVGGVAAGSYNLWQGIPNTQVVVFVQDDVTQEVYQSAIATDWTVNIPDTDELQTLIYPNPANDLINIDFNADLDDQVLISIVDVNGRLVSSDSYQGVNKVQLSVDALLAGIYFVKIEGESINQMEKIIVE